MTNNLVTSLFEYIVKSVKDTRFWIKAASAYGVYKLIYLCFLDPLRHIPGPWWSRFTSLPYQFVRFTGGLDRYGGLLHRKYGSVVRVGPNIVSVGKNKDIKYILSTYRFPKSKDYESGFMDVLDIFSTTNENFNRVRRRQVGPAFTQTGLDSVEDVVLEVGIKALKEKFDKEIELGNGEYVFNFFNTFQSLTADIIGELSFGKTFDAVKNGGHPILNWVNSSIQFSALRVIFPPANYIPFMFRGMRKDKQTLIQFTSDAIENRRALIKNNKYEASRHDILQMYITAINPDGSGLSEVELIAEIALMLLAGTDTTSVTMTWLLHFYTLYPDVYKKVVDEINQAFPDKTHLIRHKEARQKLPYFMATVYECMRLKPAVSGVLPRDSSPEGIQLAEYYIPPNTDLFIHVEGANYDTSIFEKPEKYIPERFLGENAKSYSKELVTFSSGVRICPGRNLAWMEILTVMPNFIRDYDFKLLPDSKYRPDNLDPERYYEPLLFKDCTLVTRSPYDSEHVCRLIVSHKE